MQRIASIFRVLWASDATLPRSIRSAIYAAVGYLASGIIDQGTSVTASSAWRYVVDHADRAGGLAITAGLIAAGVTHARTRTAP